MGYYKHWQTAEEKSAKQSYISISRRIVKRIVLEGLLQARDGYHIDHIFSLNAGFISKVPLIIINSIPNLAFLTSTQNNRKGDRCYQPIQELLSKWDSYEDKKRYLKLIDDFENRSNLNLEDYSRVIKV
jgi:hypothetical protein